MENYKAADTKENTKNGIIITATTKKVFTIILIRVCGQTLYSFYNYNCFLIQFSRETFGFHFNIRFAFDMSANVALDSPGRGGI